MQPYAFPYIGYFQLIHAVDRFVILDDVNYIPRGWINRNQILVGGQPFKITIPVSGGSQNSRISEVMLADQAWQTKWIKTLKASYSKAPHFPTVMPLIEDIILGGHTTIASLAKASLIRFSEHLHIDTEFIPSSAKYGNGDLKGQDRIIDICSREEATTYINPPGGRELYMKDAFSSHDIELTFIQPNSRPYTQFRNDFVPWLSIIDVLMFNSREECQPLITDYRIES